eukprot:CAMPEP_0181185212 /NCGR_PEP_ID=MMETSP1096-20121128/9384_1 /TAXON_ID=156174 ORGANISM="Chrysochromulina ericina, Strain CCMP281" /NCGR_SAMPLE_ID=MMETSP1096 /ASSEMBLY_ACC=CAM_ASM_000453 /LENGTH=120 /DNA_ID=CAMNT_0023274035 /DNA_START=494 /DNA_END=857 /DNA_ORIENTATION=-
MAANTRTGASHHGSSRVAACSRVIEEPRAACSRVEAFVRRGNRGGVWLDGLVGVRAEPSRHQQAEDSERGAHVVHALQANPVLDGFKLALPTSAPTFPIPADRPNMVVRTSVGKVSVGSV